MLLYAGLAPRACGWTSLALVTRNTKTKMRPLGVIDAVTLKLVKVLPMLPV
jgi:hypothetical protein